MGLHLLHADTIPFFIIYFQQKQLQPDTPFELFS